MIRKDGLVSGHAFCITKLATITYKGGQLKLIRYLIRFDKKTLLTISEISFIRIRNPWGNASEWNGVFSDK